MPKLFLCGFLAFCFACSGFYACPKKYDILIKSGEIYDGAGKDPVVADVGIEYLVINGKFVIDQGVYNGELAGKPIRKNSSQ